MGAGYDEQQYKVGIYFCFLNIFTAFSTSFIVDIPVDKITRPLYFFKLSNNVYLIA